ncbi:MAG: hypothetical protein NC548_57585, partial [Lachnospiraceae bacterium]|nr:hypothetical protein [Lachnospiraceae bacterium]
MINFVLFLNNTKITMKRLYSIIASSMLTVGVLAQQPYVGCWHPEDIIDWSPDTDPNAVFNRAKIPLAERYRETASMAANANQFPEGQITLASIAGPMCSALPSQGAPDFIAFQPTYWQYMDKFVHWAGSASEGIIIPPPAGFIDAAHANGVKVLGQIFFPPMVFGGRPEWVNQILTEENGEFPYAKKLYEIAEYFGFDGWFLNEETLGGSSPKWSKFIKAFHDVADADGNSYMEIQWYNASRTPNIPILSTHPQTSQFLEYGAEGDLTGFKDRITYPDGSHPEDIFSTLYAGIEVSQAGHTNYATRLNKLFKTDGHAGSAALFCPEERTWKDNVRDLLNTSDVCGAKAWNAMQATFKKEEEMWVNTAGNPANEQTGTWKGISGYIAERTAVTSIPFKSSMSVGVGKYRFIDGNIEAVGDWNHTGMQDVLPTWRWWLEDAPGVTASIDWDDAYAGSNSFMLKGSLSQGSHLLRLYKTDIHSDGTLTLTLKYKSFYNPVLCLSTEESLTPNVRIEPVVYDPNCDCWKTAVYKIDLKDASIHMIAFDFNLSVDVDDFYFALGGIAILPENFDESLTYGELTTDSSLGVEGGDLRLQWSSEWTPSFDR